MADPRQQPVWPMVPIADRFLDGKPCPTCGRVIPAAHDHFHASGYSATNMPYDWKAEAAMLKADRNQLLNDCLAILARLTEVELERDRLAAIVEGYQGPRGSETQSQ